MRMYSLPESALNLEITKLADAASARIENQQTWSEGSVLNLVTSASLLRAVLSIVTITYFFYVALLAAFPNFGSPFH